VRCNYAAPCDRCELSRLDCSYSIVRQKRGPRKGKGRILDSLRDSQSRQSTVSQFASPTSDQNLEIAPGHGILDSLRDEQSRQATASPLSSPIPGQGTSIDPVNFPIPSPPIIPTSHNIMSISHAITSAPFDSALADPDPSNVSPYDTYFSFDDFAHNILNDSGYLAYGSPANLDGSFSTPHTSGGTPVDLGALGTPQTAFPGTIVLPTELESFEITPVIRRSVQLWFEHQYPTYPVLCQATVQSWLDSQMQLSKSEQTLLWAITATSLIMIDQWPDLGWEQRSAACRSFIRKCCRLRLEWDYVENAAFEDVLVSLFIGNAYFDLKCRKTSWSFVRQAITLASAANMHNDLGYVSLTEDEAIRRRRAFALLFITERGAAIQDNLRSRQ
jgi:hypothetical protein